MTKGQPTYRLQEGPYPREVVRQWLVELRESAAAVLIRGAYGAAQDSPRRLDPKSAAWRALQSLASPLMPHERRDLQDTVAIAETWLARLDAANAETIALLSDAMVLTRCEVRLHADLQLRGVAPDLEDGRKRQAEDLKRLIGSRKGASSRRKVPAEKVERVLQQLTRENPKASRSRICELAALRLGLSASWLRHRAATT